MSPSTEPEEQEHRVPAGGRRTPMDVIRDTAWRLATAALTGPLPEPRVRAAGTSRKLAAGSRLGLTLGALAAVAGTALLVVFLVIRPYQQSVSPEQAADLPGRAPAPAASSVTATPAAVAPSRAGRSPVASPRPTDPGETASPPSAVASAVPAPVLAAGYTTTPYLVGLLGYRTEVTITNPGTTARDGWTLTVTLPRSSLWINQVSGATATQREAEWTFVPDAATRTIPAGGQVTVAFEVHGATLIDAAPTDCRIDGSPCSG